MLEALGPELAAACDVLDLGCGNGAYLAELRRIAQGRHRASRVVGADLTAAMLAGARQRCAREAALVQADAAALPFAGAVWDLVFCSHVLQFVADLDSCVEGIARTLKAGGTLVATIGASALRGEIQRRLEPGDWQALHATFGLRGRAGWEAVRGEREEACREAFARAGLTTERRSAPFELGWADIEEWIRLRWLSVAEPQARALAEAVLARNRTRIEPDLTITIAEPLLLGAKPAQLRS